MRIRKLSVVLFLSLCLLFAGGITAYAQDGVLTDVSGHWAEQTISKWAAEGVLGGYPDGTFQPNRQITRAEFITVINKALGSSVQGKVNFSDVKESNWFYGEVAKAVRSGYIKGYQDGTFKPNNPISRQEAAVIFSRIMYLVGDSQGASQFADGNSIPSWSRGMVGAVAKAGYMGGYPDKTFQPNRSITRAESVATLSRVVGELFNEAGVFGPETRTVTVHGNVTISKPDVTLQNTIIEGTLYLAEGIGEGTVTLKNVTVNGNTIVRGGGINSIIMYNFNGKTVVVDVPEGSRVRLVAQGTSTVGDVVLESDGILEEENLTGTGFTNVVIPAGAQVTLVGNFNQIDVAQSNVTVNLTEGTVNVLNIEDNTVNTRVILAAGTAVTNLNVKAPAVVEGTGTIQTATVTSSNVTIQQTPTNTNVADTTENVTIGGDSTPGGGSGGGGGGGGSKPSITVSDITITFSDIDPETDVSAPFTFNLKDTGDYPDDTLFTGIIIDGSNVKGSTLVITQVNLAAQNWVAGDEPIEAVIPETGVITTKDLLMGLDTGVPGVNLGSLREFGQSIIFTGYVERSGYNSSPTITFTLELSHHNITDLEGVTNEWLSFHKSGITVSGTIKEGKSGEYLKNVDVLSFLWTLGEISTTSSSSGYVSGETEIKKKIAQLAGLGANAWDDVTLGHLAGKTIYYKSATGLGAYVLAILAE